MKKILIIGATSAIASSCARKWLDADCVFFLVGRNKEKLNSVADDLLARGAKSVSCFIMDAMDYSRHESMLTECISVLQSIDIALIAQGTLPKQSDCEHNVVYAVREFDNNATSVIALLTILAKQFETQGFGSIAVISSVAGDRGRPSNYLYGAAKGAVSIYCDGLRARLYKSGVHVITIKPGFVDTPMTHGLALPAALVAKPDDVAASIVKGVAKKKNILYAPFFWSLIMLVIKTIPTFIFKRMGL